MHSHAFFDVQRQPSFYTRRLNQSRETMRRAYVAPLREGIERLGRHVFGPSLCVEIDESLNIVSRTIDGVTVPLGQLSTGAQEQMGLLVRLATALIVAKEGGVPLVSMTRARIY